MPSAFELRLPKFDLSKLFDGSGELAIDLATRALFGQEPGAAIAKTAAMHYGQRAAAQVKSQLFDHASESREELEAGRERWEEWLRTTPFALINVSGAPGMGKTTAACDLVDRFFVPEGRTPFVIGIPQALLPDTWREISVTHLRLLGKRLTEVINQGRDPKSVLASFIPPGAVILCDDASIYLASKEHKRPENRAVQELLNVRRHLELVFISTFQSYRHVANQLTTQADAHVMKLPSLLTLGPEGDATRATDRDEVTPWLREAAARLQRVSDEHRILTAFVTCPEAQFAGTWRHKRPDWYGQNVSQNVLAGSDGGAYDIDNALEGQFTETRTEASMYWCSTCSPPQFHRRDSAIGQEHATAA